MTNNPNDPEDFEAMFNALTPDEQMSFFRELGGFDPPGETVALEDMEDTAKRVEYVPAPDDSDHPWYDQQRPEFFTTDHDMYNRLADELAKECPDPDCICKK